MKHLLAKLVLLTAPEVSILDRLKYLWDCLLTLAPIALILKTINWWFSENQQFGQFMCAALTINLIVGAYYHMKTKTFNFKEFIYKNLEMAFVVIMVYIMLDMLRYTAGANIAGDIFKVVIQITTLLYPTSKVLKNVYIITEGKYPPEYLMNRLYNFEKNGDLKDFFDNKKDKK